MPMHAHARSAPPRTDPYAALRAPIRALIDQGHFTDALRALLEVYSAFPSNPGLLDDMASCYWNLGDHDTALKLLHLIVQDAPGNTAAWGKIGALLISAGDNDGAAKAFERVLKSNPKSVGALAALNRIDVFARDSRRARLLRKLSQKPGLPSTDRATALNALGRIEDKAGNTTRACGFFRKSKALTPGSYDADAMERHVAAQLRSPVSPASGPGGGPRVVFVTGLPRSGTTLVERILTRHPEIGTIGESPALQQVLQDIRRRTGDTTGWNWVERVTPEQLEAARTHYLALARQRIGTPLPGFIIDKLPLNCLEMTFAQRLLPGARIVFVSRHPLDLGLSLLSTHFHAAHAFSKTPETIAHMTRAVYTSLADFEDRLGAAIVRRQSYRALVETPEAQIRALLGHVGASWTSACLAPEAGPDMVRTASLTQVRAGINTGALNRRRRYEQELAPLRAALGGQHWIDDWQRADDGCAKAQGAVNH